MPRSHVFDPSFRNIDWPHCIQCGSLMWLARISPDKPHYDRRTFECPVCNHSEEVVVEYKKE
jgi:hypothetical protein